MVNWINTASTGQLLAMGFVIFLVMILVIEVSVYFKFKEPIKK
jgi:hypothetical protein